MNFPASDESRLHNLLNEGAGMKMLFWALMKPTFSPFNEAVVQNHSGSSVLQEGRTAGALQQSWSMPSARRYSWIIDAGDAPVAVKLVKLLQMLTLHQVWATPQPGSACWVCGRLLVPCQSRFWCLVNSLGCREFYEICQPQFGAEIKSEDDDNNKYRFLSRNVALLLTMEDFCLCLNNWKVIWDQMVKNKIR